MMTDQADYGDDPIQLTTTWFEDIRNATIFPEVMWD